MRNLSYKSIFAFSRDNVSPRRFGSDLSELTKIVGFIKCKDAHNGNPECRQPQTTFFE